jgi:membrane-bound inhibitor of C-type lysozyme
MKKLLLVTALATTLAACTTMSSPAPAVGERTEWKCDHGAAFSVRFTTESAEVFAGGQTYSLPHAQSGSGARYANGAVEYWEHAGEAMLNGAAGGPYANCRRG